MSFVSGVRLYFTYSGLDMKQERNERLRCLHNIHVPWHSSSFVFFFFFWFCALFFAVQWRARPVQVDTPHPVFGSVIVGSVQLVDWLTWEHFFRKLLYTYVRLFIRVCFFFFFVLCICELLYRSQGGIHVYEVNDLSSHHEEVFWGSLYIYSVYTLCVYGVYIGRACFIVEEFHFPAEDTPVGTEENDIWAKHTFPK